MVIQGKRLWLMIVKKQVNLTLYYVVLYLVRNNLEVDCMKLVDLTCPHCGAQMKADAAQKQVVCEHCGTNILIDDEVQHVQYDNAEEAGYNFEKGRQRAQAESGQYRTQQINNAPQQPPKKRKTWLWVLGWLFIFPLPLTILLLRKKDMKPQLKYGILAAAWIVYLIIGLAGRGGSDSTSRETTGVVANSNIREISFLKIGDKDITVKVGGSTSESYVNVSLKDKDAFSPEDVVFVSENPDIATIEYTKDVLTTCLYYKINGISAGETYVYAMSADGSVMSEKMKVIVEGSGKNITDMTFADPRDVTVKIGQDSNTGTLNVTLSNSWDFSNEDVVFVSEDPSVATITHEGSSYGKTVRYQIHGVGTGTTHVYAQSNDGIITSDKIRVIVPEPINVEEISFDFEELTIAIGESRALSTIISPEDADSKEVKWSSADSSIATVDQNGMLIGVAGGTTTITAEASNGVSASFNLVVDGSMRLMSLRVSHPREDDNNIGDEWSYYNEVNGENARNEYAIAVGDTLSFYSKYTESDDNPDVGEARKTYTVTEEDLQNGFTVSMDVYVRENAGRNSGQTAHFVVTYTFTVK